MVWYALEVNRSIYGGVTAEKNDHGGFAPVTLTFVLDLDQMAGDRQTDEEHFAL